jgi:hypothetical protein
MAAATRTVGQTFGVSLGSIVISGRSQLQNQIKLFPLQGKNY